MLRWKVTKGYVDSTWEYQREYQGSLLISESYELVEVHNYFNEDNSVFINFEEPRCYEETACLVFTPVVILSTPVSQNIDYYVVEAILSILFSQNLSSTKNYTQDTSEQNSRRIHKPQIQEYEFSGCCVWSYVWNSTTVLRNFPSKHSESES